MSVSGGSAGSYSGACTAMKTKHTIAILLLSPQNGSLRIGQGKPNGQDKRASLVLVSILCMSEVSTQLTNWYAQKQSAAPWKGAC